VKSTLVILKVNGRFPYPFRVWAEDDYAAGLTAKIHLALKTGMGVV
jgi:hypothetical protein